MHPNQKLIERFYACFNARDGDGMAACYASDAEFSDPVFMGLTGAEAGAMWRMLCSRAADLQVKVSNISANDSAGSAHWDASYTFSKTGRKVLNSIDADFTFRNGLIQRHVDTFDLWRWAGMALGTKGQLLGWLPPVQASIRAEARKGLDAFMARAR